jgi:hypothetical protein
MPRRKIVISRDELLVGIEQTAIENLAERRKLPMFKFGDHSCWAWQAADRGGWFPYNIAEILRRSPSSRKRVVASETLRAMADEKIVEIQGNHPRGQWIRIAPRYREQR